MVPLKPSLAGGLPADVVAPGTEREEPVGRALDVGGAGPHPLIDVDMDRWSVDVVAAPRVQLPVRFSVVVTAAGIIDEVPESHVRLLVHNLVAHLLPGGTLVVMLDGSIEERSASAGRAVADLDEIAAECGLRPVGSGAGEHRWTRTERVTVHDLVAEARRDLQRLTPVELDRLRSSDPSVVVIDTRTPTDRERFGVIEGSVHMPRTNLEWMVDPASGYSHPSIRSFDQRLVVVCHEGYSSSLAAASLHRLGFTNATDLVGGVHGWIAAGLPVVSPDHTRC